MSLKKIKRDPVPRSKLIVRKHCRNDEYCFFSNYYTLNYPASLFHVIVVSTDEMKL